MRPPVSSRTFRRDGDAFVTAVQRLHRDVVQIIDVSVPVRPGMITYPGDPEVRLERVSSIADGDVANLSRLALGVHSGTHVDAPLHFLDGGASVETLPLDVLVGPCVVVEGLEVAAVPAGAARALVAGGVRLVGIDYLSIGDEDAHWILLGAGVVAVEGLDLRNVEPGEYRLICAPLKLVGSEGAPARVLLLRD